MMHIRQYLDEQCGPGKWTIVENGPDRATAFVPPAHVSIVELWLVGNRTIGTEWKVVAASPMPTGRQFEGDCPFRLGVPVLPQPPNVHIHAELMAMYAADAAKAAEPWKLWEFCNRTTGNEWRACSFNPDWTIHTMYRRKPRTIRIGAVDVPAPVAAIDTGNPYWLPNLFGDEPMAMSPWHQSALGRGLVHDTPEAARAHAEALIALSRLL